MFYLVDKMYKVVFFLLLFGFIVYFFWFYDFVFFLSATIKLGIGLVLIWEINHTILSRGCFSCYCMPAPTTWRAFQPTSWCWFHLLACIKPLLVSRYDWVPASPSIVSNKISYCPLSWKETFLFIITQSLEASSPHFLLFMTVSIQYFLF